jgi:hypothetical protein
MDPYRVSAQFVAYSWFMKHNAVQPSAAAAAQFARSNWASFLPCAHQGLGQLLIRIARPAPNGYGRATSQVRLSRLCREHAAAG